MRPTAEALIEEENDYDSSKEVAEKEKEEKTQEIYRTKLVNKGDSSAILVMHKKPRHTIKMFDVIKVIFLLKRGTYLAE